MQRLEGEKLWEVLRLEGEREIVGNAKTSLLERDWEVLRRERDCGKC